MFLDPNAILIAIFGLAIILGVIGALLVGLINSMAKNAWNSWETAIRRTYKNLTK